MKRLVCLAVCANCLLSTVVRSQDIHFSQFYETVILRNPALMGLFNGDYKVNANYRNQWSSISAPYVTGQLSFETRIPVEETHDFFSAGLLAYQDKAGSIDMKTVSVYPAISFNKSLGDANNSYLSAGFAGGYIQRSFDPAKMTVNNQYQNGSYNPALATGENIADPTISFWDLGAAVSISSGGGENSDASYFAGISGFHITKPRTTFYNSRLVQLDMKWNMNAGFTYRFSEIYGVMLQANYAVQGKYSELIGGGLFHWKKPSERRDEPLFIVYFGSFYRLKDAIIPVVKVDYMRFSFGFSYDVNMSRLRTASNLRGGYELSIAKTGLFKDPKWQRGRTNCPHFFW